MKKVRWIYVCATSNRFCLKRRRKKCLKNKQKLCSSKNTFEIFVSEAIRINVKCFAPKIITIINIDSNMQKTMLVGKTSHVINWFNEKRVLWFGIGAMLNGGSSSSGKQRWQTAVAAITTKISETWNETN